MATASKIILAALGLIRELLAMYRKYQESKRVDAVRADPAGEWMRKFGGTDRRDEAGSSPDNSGRDSNK